MPEKLIPIIQTALKAISLLLSHPGLGGGGSIRAKEAVEIITMLGILIAEGEEAYEELEDFTQQIDAMAQVARAPTPKEWLALRNRSRNAHERMEKVAETLVETDDDTEDVFSGDDESDDDGIDGTED